MTQIPSHILDADAVVHTFYRHGLRRRVVSRLAGMLMAVGVLGLCVFVVLAVDAAWPLAVGVRLAIEVGVLMAWGVVVWRLWPTRPDARQEALRNARHAERHYSLKGNPLVNALWLVRQAGRDGDDFATVLARRSVTGARRILESISLDVLIDSRPLRRAGVGVTVILSVWLTALWFQPDLLAGGLARFADPFGDHPPFSLTRFAVTVDPARVHVGDDAAVRVELTGRVPDRVSLAQVDKQGNVLQRWPMQRMGHGRFERQWMSIDEPVSFWIEADTGRSHRVDLVPAPRLQATDRESEADASQQSFDAAGGKAGSAVADGAHAGRHASIRLDELTNAAKRLQEYANELLGRLGQLNQADRQALDSIWTRLKHLNQRLERFDLHSRALTGSLRGRIDEAGDARSDQSLVESLRRLADQLERMELLRAKPYSAGGDGVGRQGEVFLDPSNLTAWLGRIRSAADNDVMQLGRGQAMLRQALAQTRGVGDPGQFIEPGQGLLARRGSYDETVSSDSTAVVQTDAVMQSVPGAYRHLVTLYFERLLKDQPDR